MAFDYNDTQQSGCLHKSLTPRIHLTSVHSVHSLNLMNELKKNFMILSEAEMKPPYEQGFQKNGSGSEKCD